MTLDVSKLSGWLNAVAACRVERRVCDAGRVLGRGRREGVGRRQRTSGMHDERVRLKAEGARACAERTWNMPSMSVTLDVSKLSGWLNAVACCRVERRACDVGRGTAQEREGVRWRRRNQHARGGPDSRMGARARAERTANMSLMSVTLDVLKLSGWLNADARCRVERQACDARRGAVREA